MSFWCVVKCWVFFGGGFTSRVDLASVLTRQTKRQPTISCPIIGTNTLGLQDSSLRERSEERERERVRERDHITASTETSPTGWGWLAGCPLSDIWNMKCHFTSISCLCHRSEHSVRSQHDQFDRGINVSLKVWPKENHLERSFYKDATSLWNAIPNIIIASDFQEAYNNPNFMIDPNYCCRKSFGTPLEFMTSLVYLLIV